MKCVNKSDKNGDLAGRLLGPSVFFGALAMYLRTIAPNVTFWDSGELSLGALTLGLPHPPAYPLFCLLGRLFTMIPFGNIAYRTNLMSAVFGAASAWILFIVVRRLAADVRGGEFLAAAAGLLFAFHETLWSIAVITEVYTINAFLIGVLLYTLLSYEQSLDEKYLHLSALVFGLAFANHQSVLLSLPGYAAYYLFRNGVWRRPLTVAVSLLFAVLGMSVNLYLPLRGSVYPALDIGVPVTPENLAWVLKLASYKDSFRSILGHLPDLLAGLDPVVTAGLIAVAATAAYLLRGRRFSLMLVVLVAFNLVGIMALAAGSAEARKFHLQTKFYVPAVLFGVVLASDLFCAFLAKSGSGRVRSWPAGAAAALVFSAAVYQIPLNIEKVDNSENWFAYDLGHNTLKSLSQDAIIFGYGDNGVFPIWYAQGAEHYREDVLLVYPEIMTYSWYMEGLRDGLREKYGIEYRPPSAPKNLKENLDPLRAAAAARIQTYYDYSAMLQVGIPWEKVKFQGIVHLDPAWPGTTEARVWDRYVMRGVFDDSTNKSFAAESILDIYAFELGVWAQLAQENGKEGEALAAYRLARQAGLKNPQLEKWYESITAKRSNN